MTSEENIAIQRLLILSSLHNGGNYYGTLATMRASLTSSGIAMSEAALQGHVHDLVDKGLLAEVKRPSVNDNLTGYRLTDAGRAALN